MNFTPFLSLLIYALFGAEERPRSFFLHFGDIHTLLVVPTKVRLTPLPRHLFKFKERSIKQWNEKFAQRCIGEILL